MDERQVKGRGWERLGEDLGGCERMGEDVGGLFRRIGFQLSQCIDIVAEEVMVEDNGDAHEQFSVYSGALEYLVDIGTVAVEFASEPADAPLLSFEFVLDELSYMDVSF